MTSLKIVGGLLLVALALAVLVIAFNAAVVTRPVYDCTCTEPEVYPAIEGCEIVNVKRPLEVCTRLWRQESAVQYKCDDGVRVKKYEWDRECVER